MDRLSTKVSIPHTIQKNVALVGILEQLAPEKPTRDRKLALLLHGTMGHKDYLHHQKLAANLPIDSFRFDFRGNYESGGVWGLGNLADDVEDIQVVVDYLKANYGYVVDLVIGHSRGSIVSFRWLSTSVDGRKVSAFVNMSGRYRMPKMLELPAVAKWTEEIAKQGHVVWHVTVAKRPTSVKVTSEDLQKFAAWDTSFVWNDFPQVMDVLTIHGLSDETVPPYDALIYARALGDRAPGTHTLRLVENADHVYTSHQDDVVESVIHWWNLRQAGTLKTGIWIFDTKGRL